MLSPKAARIELAPGHDKYKQFVEFKTALDLAFKQGGWTVFLDELFYLDDKLGLEDEIETLLTQGRSKGISVISGIQRPVQVTRYALSQSTHNVSFALEGRDAKSMAEVNPRWANAIMQLRRHEFAWYYRPTRQIWIGKVQDLGGSV